MWMIMKEHQLWGMFEWKPLENEAGCGVGGLSVWTFVIRLVIAGKRHHGQSTFCTPATVIIVWASDLISKSNPDRALQNLNTALHVRYVHANLVLRAHTQNHVSLSLSVWREREREKNEVAFLCGRPELPWLDGDKWPHYATRKYISICRLLLYGILNM